MGFKRGDKMDINTFMFTLMNELYENEFYGVEISNYYNEYDKRFLIHIVVKRNNHKHVYGYSISEKWIDNNSIEKIVNELLRK